MATIVLPMLSLQALLHTDAEALIQADTILRTFCDLDSKKFSEDMGDKCLDSGTPSCQETTSSILVDFCTWADILVGDSGSVL
jgi:hypothetical protein